MEAVPCSLRCEHRAKCESLLDQTAYKFECDVCGRYIIGRRLRELLRAADGDDAKLLPYLRAHTRQATEEGQTAELTEVNWRDLARGHANTAVSTKLRRLLEFVSNRSRFPGDQVEITEDAMYPLFDAASAEELGFLITHLGQRALLTRGELDGYFVLSVEGWAFIEPSVGGIVGRCFVAMSFDRSLDDVYENGIRPAVKDDCGFDPVRIDRLQHNDKICDKILAEIRLAQFVVADFTLHRAGVYFEAGFAMGLGRPVIWACRKDDLPNAHFDTRQYNHIEWDTPGELRRKLADRIRATIVR
jgi:hypothetical protein